MAKIIKDGKKFNPMWVYAVIVVAILVWSYLGNNTAPKVISWNVFNEELLAKGDVEKVVIVNKEIAQIYIKKDKVKELKEKEEYKNIPETGVQFEFEIGSLDKFETRFEYIQSELDPADRAPLEFKKEGSWLDYVGGILPFLIIIAIWFFIMRSMRGGGKDGNVFNVGKAAAQVYDKNSTAKVMFKDVAGLEEVKVEIMEIVDFLKNPKKYSELGASIPKGALLVGPPGTGKTLLAKAVAGEANVPFLSMSGSDFVEMFVGVGASRVRDLFKQAKEKSPCIVFIDEIDAIGRARSKNGGYSSNDERENTLNQLLTEMDGFGTNSGVIILAATNRADILDKALMRAGRFDRQIHVELPDVIEREAILDVHMKKLKVGGSVSTKFFAKQTPGFSGADLANVCNEAALIAARRNKTAVEKQDILDAIDRIIGGLERKNKLMTPKEKRTIAFHEAGHASVSWLLHYANPLIKVTIVPRGKALGAAWYMPEERQITTKMQMMHEMAAILGGRVSEQLSFGEVSTGALNDLERVTRLAYSIVAFYGMGDKVKNMSFYNSTGQDTFTKPYSEKTAEQIDIEVKAIIDEAYKMAEDILTNHKENLNKLAEMLIEREVVFGEDLEEIFGKRRDENGNEVETMSRGVKEDRIMAENEVRDIEAREREAMTDVERDADDKVKEADLREKERLRCGESKEETMLTDGDKVKSESADNIEKKE